MLPADLPTDLPSFQARFGTDEQCRDYLFEARWPDGFRCTGCGHADAYRHKKRLIDECVACGEQHSLLAGTMRPADIRRRGAGVAPSPPAWRARSAGPTPTPTSSSILHLLAVPYLQVGVSANCRPGERRSARPAAHGRVSADRCLTTVDRYTDRDAVHGPVARALGRQGPAPARLRPPVGQAEAPEGGRGGAGGVQKGFAELVAGALPEHARGKPVEVWFLDEARVGQQGTLTRVWARHPAASAPRPSLHVGPTC